MQDVRIQVTCGQDDIKAVLKSITTGLSRDFRLTLSHSEPRGETYDLVYSHGRRRDLVTTPTVDDLAPFKIPYGADTLFTEIKRCGLLDALAYVLNNNDSEGLPYHNTEHMLGMTAIAIQLHNEQTEANILIKRRVLILAGLFHDFNHSGGVNPDVENIDVACKEVVKFMVTDRDEPAPGALVRAVQEAITCTQYPFTIEPATTVQRCLRDADILYTTLRNDPVLVMEKLRSEVQVSLGKPISYSEFMAGHEVFAASVTLYTGAGQALYGLNREDFLQTLRLYVQTHTKQWQLTVTTDGHPPKTYRWTGDLSPSALSEEIQGYSVGDADYAFAREHGVSKWYSGGACELREVPVT